MRIGLAIIAMFVVIAVCLAVILVAGFAISEAQREMDK